MAKQATQDTILYVEEDGVSGSYLAIGNITSIRTPSPDKPEIDVTDFDSSGAEFLLGLPDFGSIDFTGWYNTSSAGQVQMRDDGISTASTTRTFRLDLTNFDERWTFSGQVKGFVVEAGLNSAYTFNGTIRTTGAPTITSIP